MTKYLLFTEIGSWHQGQIQARCPDCSFIYWRTDDASPKENQLRSLHSCLGDESVVDRAP